MKKIYIVVTRTGTMLSKIIQSYTKDEFSHVSISLDKELNEMYSFGRLNPHNPFIGGFVHEGINIGTFKRFYKTIAQISCLEVTDEQYDNAKKTIYEIEQKKGQYKFNTLGLFAVAFKIKRKKNKYFYCAEFVKYVLEKSNIINNLPELIRPEDFKALSGAEKIYYGRLNKYMRE